MSQITLNLDVDYRGNTTGMHIGRFVLRQSIIVSKPHVVHLIMAHCIPIEIEIQEEEDDVLMLYTALSPQFKEIEDNQIIPGYDVKVELQCGKGKVNFILAEGPLSQMGGRMSFPN